MECANKCIRVLQGKQNQFSRDICKRRLTTGVGEEPGELVQSESQGLRARGGAAVGPEVQRPENRSSDVRGWEHMAVPA